MGEGWQKWIIVFKTKLQQGAKVREGVFARQLQVLKLRVRGVGRDS